MAELGKAAASKASSAAIVKSRPHRGRPRDAAVDQRMKRAALETLAEHGFSRLSVEAICLRARVPRSTFYRRWPAPWEAVIDAFSDAAEDARFDPPDTGELLHDLTIFASRLGAMFADPVLGACMSFIGAEMHLRPDLRDRLLEDWSARRLFNRAMFERAAQRGEELPTIKPDLLFDILVGLTLVSASAGKRLETTDYVFVLERLLATRP